MTTEQALDSYLKAIYAGGWEDMVADNVMFARNSLAPESITHDKASYVSGAGRFYKTTTAVDIRGKFINADNAAILAHYDVISPSGKKGTCDVGEFLTFENGKLTRSAIFFDTKSLAEFMAS